MQCCCCARFCAAASAPAVLLLLLFVQWRTCTKTAAAALHWRDRITRALRRDRAAGGGHYKASAWEQCKKQWLCWFLHDVQRARKHHSVEYRHGSCIAMFCTFCRLFDAHAADDEYNEKAPGAPRCVALVLSCCSSTLLVSRSFSFLPPAFQGLFSWHQPSAYLRTF